MTYSNEWFDGPYAIKTPPIEAILDCSGPGAKDEPVEYWVNKLGFDGPAWLIRDHLEGFGAWSNLCDHQENLRRLFWIWCNDIREAVSSCGMEIKNLQPEELDGFSLLYLSR